MRIGYDQDFIGDGFRVPLPTVDTGLGRSILKDPQLRDERYSDHAHFTLVMNEHTRQLVYSAYNIDQARLIPNPPDKGSRGWRFDPNIDRSHQLGNQYYKDRRDGQGDVLPNPYDRGHMVMRFNNMWGANQAESDKAGKATFIYSNASLQHENLNRDEWKMLELGVVRELRDTANRRLNVFTGPIYGDLDRHVNLSDHDSARVPAGFFKVICYARKDPVDDQDRLGVLAFAIFQDAQVLRDKRGGAQVKVNQSYQVTISELSELTGIHFGERLFDANPLLFFNNAVNRRTADLLPERIPIIPATDVVGSHTDDRAGVEHLANRKIVIVSAMINPRGRDHTGEWVSLFNRGGRKILLDGWVLVDGKNRRTQLRGSIESGGALKVKGARLKPVRLNNGEGNLALLDEDGCVIDFVSWSRPQVRRVSEGTAFLFDNFNS